MISRPAPGLMFQLRSFPVRKATSSQGRGELVGMQLYNTFPGDGTYHILASGRGPPSVHVSDTHYPHWVQKSLIVPLGHCTAAGGSKHTPQLTLETRASVCLGLPPPPKPEPLSYTRRHNHPATSVFPSHPLTWFILWFISTHRHPLRRNDPG